MVFVAINCSNVNTSALAVDVLGTHDEGLVALSAGDLAEHVEQTGVGREQLVTGGEEVRGAGPEPP